MDKKTRNVSHSNSQRKSVCVVCNETVTFRNLLRHFTQNHPNETPKEKPPEGVKSLKAFFTSTNNSSLGVDIDIDQVRNGNVTESAAVPVLDNISEHENVPNDCVLNVPQKPCDTNTECSANVSESAVVPVLDNISEHEKVPNDCAAESVLKKTSDTTCNNDFSQALDALDVKVQLILDNFENFRVGTNSKADKVTASAYNERDLDSACAAESIDDIMERLCNWKLHFPNQTAKEKGNPDGLYCIFCNTEVSEIKAKTGVVHYNFSLGDNFKRANGLPREFRNFKTKMKAHMDSPFHAEKVAEHLQLENVKRSNEFITRNEKAGMACARNAYKAIYSNHSYLSYETEVAKDAANNVDVGEINHSADFCSEMVDSFYSCLKRRFNEQIALPLKGTGRPSPVTFIFDKYTPMHRTLNIIAANMYIGGALETVFLDCPVVQHHDAKGLADNLSNSIAKLLSNDQWKKSYCGSSADGQMICLGYGAHLDGMISANGDQFFTHIWDARHLIELASDDSTKQNKWVSDITSVVTETTKNFKYGKRLEELIEIQQDSNPDGQLYSPRSFSSTRWATYCHTTLTSFLNNYPYYYDHLQRSQDDLTDKINTVDFVAKCAILTDVYSQIAILSRILQCPILYFWRIERAVTITCDNLLEMSDALQDENFPCSELKIASSPHSEDFILRSAAVALNEMSQAFTYKSKPVLNKQHLPVATRSSALQPKCQDQSQNEAIRRCRQEAAKFINSLIESLKSRTDANNCQVLAMACKAFDLQEIYRREEGSVEGLTAFIEYAEVAMEVNFLERFPLDELKTQYTEFEAFVRNAEEEWYGGCSFGKKREFEMKLYNKILHNPSTFAEVNHLLASATVRLANESQCESIGSVVGRHYEHRGSLNVEKISKEVFISWNGPPPFNQSNTLLKDALYSRFGGGPEKWHFLRITRRPDLLKMFKFESKVIDRLNRYKPRINYNYDYE